MKPKPPASSERTAAIEELKQKWVKKNQQKQTPPELAVKKKTKDSKK